MIAGLHGKLEARGLDHALVRVGGFTLQVFMPTSALARLGGVGEEVHLHTHLHVREDILALYGFVTPQELALFQSLMGVTGVGPRLALAVLSTYSAQELTLAIMGGSVDVLSQVPGLGKKIAARLVLELKGKLGGVGEGALPPEMAGENAEIVAALTGLGYTASEASKAALGLPADPGLGLEEKIRLALQQLGKG